MRRAKSHSWFSRGQQSIPTPLNRALLGQPLWRKSHIAWTARRQSHPPSEVGAGLPFALVIALVLVISGAALASRILTGTYGAVYNQDARRAREAAESGVTRIIAELNRERNRMLLAINPSVNGFWSGSEAASAVAENPCAVSSPNTPNLSLIRSGGASATINPDGPVVVYVADDGTLTAQEAADPDQTRPENERSAFQLVTSDEVAVPSIRVQPSRCAWAPFQQCQMTIRVRGFSYNNNQLAAAVTIEQQLEVLPKFCGCSLNGDPIRGEVFGSDARNNQLPCPTSPTAGDFVSRAVRRFLLLPGS